MKKIFLFIFLASLALSACNVKTRGSYTDQNTTANTTITEQTVWGMTCSRCERRITRAITALDGVINISVDLRANKVTIEHNSSLDVDTIKKAITSEGFNIP